MAAMISRCRRYSRPLLYIDSEHPFEPPGESLMRASAGGGGASPCSAEMSVSTTLTAGAAPCGRLSTLQA
jgi:hypothetical protein